MTIKAGNEYAAYLSRLQAGTDEIAKRAVYAGARVLADAVRANLEKALEGSETSTGDLLDSLGVTPIAQDGDGNWNAKIGFDGYDRKGTPNQIKARAMESGTSTQPKRPFVRPAVASKGKEARAEMARVIVEGIQEIE